MDFAKEYNANMTKLINIISNKYENKNKDITELKRLISVGISTDFDLLIKESGPYLLEYSDIINGGNVEKFILETDFSNKIDKDADKSSIELIKNLIDGVKNIWPKLIDKEKTIVVNIIQNLLILYSNYIVKNRV